MKYSFRITVEIPEHELYHKPTREEVAEFLAAEAFTAGGASYHGDADSVPDWRFTFYRFAKVRVT